MSRIENTFQELKQKGEKALVAYLTAGYPSLEQTREIILAMGKSGTDLIEVGVPFSDPTADGPIIQAASQQALQKGVTLTAILGMIADIRKVSDIPIVLFSYYNPVLTYGPERFAQAAQEAGVDGILIVDLPFEESEELRIHTDPAGLDFISLIAPTTPDERVRRITAHSSGFIYYISVTGVTGTAKPDASVIEEEVQRIRKHTTLPVAVGFGISSPQQAAEIAPYADGIVIGSAFVKMIEENSQKANLPEILAGFAFEIKAALRKT